jgi:hypothetical protein
MATDTIHLIRNDVAGILHHGQPATIDEIEWLLAHGEDPQIMLSYVEETGLRNVATRILADEFIVKGELSNV